MEGRLPVSQHRTTARSTTPGAGHRSDPRRAFLPQRTAARAGPARGAPPCGSGRHRERGNSIREGGKDDPCRAPSGLGDHDMVVTVARPQKQSSVFERRTPLPPEGGRPLHRCAVLTRRHQRPARHNAAAPRPRAPLAPCEAAPSCSSSSRAHRRSRLHTGDRQPVGRRAVTLTTRPRTRT